MIFLVAGASGFLGRALTRRLEGHEIVRTARSRLRADHTGLDARDPAAVQRLIHRVAPDVVVNLIAERRPEFWDNKSELSRTNTATATHLAAAAHSAGARFIHVSTDYVFDGETPPYARSAPHGPLNSYGRTKSAAEAAVLAANRDSLIVRMPVLYGPVERLDECNLSDLVPPVMRGRPVAVDDWAVRRPTFVGDVARSLAELALSDEGYGPVVHVSGPDPVTKYDMAVAIATAAGVGTVHLIRKSEPSPSRPRDTTLDCGGPGSLDVSEYVGFADGLRAVLPGYLTLWQEAQA
ncbi:SDR family oxidoreductase [Streptomyces canus]